MPHDPSDGNLDSDLIAAEAKRIAARRRFLKQTTAAGSGILILTFPHQRADATTLVVSSLAVCLSMGGTPVGRLQVRDVANPTGPQVTALECQLP